MPITIKSLNPTSAYKFLQEIRSLPKTEINLMLDQALSNPYYYKIAKSFYDDARKPHPKFPLIRKMEWGVASCALPDTFSEYFSQLEGSARRNYKKSLRLGYQFKPVNIDDYLDEVTEIRQSTPIRQGKKLPDKLYMKRATPNNEPEPKNSYHAYPYFGVFDKNEKLRAYCGCLIAGEVCMIEQIMGHADFHSDGCIPLMIISIAQHLLENNPAVRFYNYGNYFGANPSMKRFKRKFQFLPKKVTWVMQKN